MPIGATQPVFRRISSLFQQTPVEVLCHRTTGADRVRRAEDIDGVVASGRRKDQFIRVVSVHEPMGLVSIGSSGYLAAAISGTVEITGHS